MDKHLVLIIDDSPLVQETLKQCLHDEYDLLFANTGEAGVELAHKERPDLILLDVIMPTLDGFGVIKALRNSSDTRDIPIIMLTSISDQNCEANGLMAGASDYINKPINGLIVKLRVSIQIKMLGYRRAIEQLTAELAELKGAKE